MADTSPSRLGIINGTTDGTFAQNNALFLKVFSGEILTTFEEMNVMKDLHMVRTISSGKSAQFPVTGIATAKYHTAGEDIIDNTNGYLSQIKHNEKVINIDDLLIASTFIANIDELKNHYDVRSIYAKELGKALAKRFDIATMKVLVAAARSTGNYTGAAGGTIIDNGSGGSFFGTDGVSAQELIDALYAMATALDEKDAPDADRFAILRPADYYTLLTSDNVAISKDFGMGGDVARGVIPMVAGIKLYKSNHLTDISVALNSQEGDDVNSNNSVFGGGTGYNGDLSATRVIGGTKEAIGTVKLLDLATESEYQIQRQGTLFVAKYAMGHGVLRPECAVEIR